MTKTPQRRRARRAKPDDPTRTRAGVIAIGAAGALLAAGAAAVAGLLLKRREDAAPHGADDLKRDDRPGAEDRAPEAFRPDPYAAPTAAEREGLAPATIPVEPRGGTIADHAPTNP